ncbi:MAG: hypothetical protein JXA68_01280 [Ignavibacteriales bacterium]|nr:hypothetical protein [Ignavibacteriales bacterium]
MKITIFQYSPLWCDKILNIEKIVNILDSINLKTDILVFPEMTLTGFTMDSSKHSEKLDGLSFAFFSQLAKRERINVLSGIIFEERKKYFNSLFHFGKDGKIISGYKKIHPFSPSGENLYYTAGNKPVISKYRNFTFGLSICYDLRFPELFRFYGKKRCDVIFCIANWPERRIEQWKILLQARAIENQCFVVGVNRNGRDQLYYYPGCSAVVDPMGNFLFLAAEKENFSTIDLDLKLVKSIREKLPFLKDIKLI